MSFASLRTRFDRPIARRSAAAVAVFLYTIVGYRLIGFGADPARAHSLRTALDDRIPFLPWTVYLYSWVYTSMLFPLFVVRCPRLFNRVVGAYLAVVTVSLTTFALFPVTSVGFRPDPAGLDSKVFHEWGVQLTFFVDPPMNLFPSLHLSIALIAMLAAGRARRLFGLLAAPIVAGIAVSISTMKQHFLADGLAAGVLAIAVDSAILRRCIPSDVPRAERAYGWRGPTLYLAFHAAVYGLLWILFRTGFRPWLAGT